MGSLIPNAKVQFSDASGRPLVGGLVYMYVPATETFKDTFQDRNLSIPNTNPIVLDAFGEAVIWGTGVYRQVLTDVNGVQIWDQLTQDSNAGLIGNITDGVFKAGTDFTPGTTNVLTLPAAPGAIQNMWVFFDGTFQTDDQIASLNQTTLTFNSPIPVGVSEVTVKIGTTVAVGTPGTGTIIDASVATGAAINASKLSFLQAGANAVRRTVLSKLQDIVSVLDFGAKGDGINDDTAAMQAAHNTGKLVRYPAGTYKFSTLSFAAGGIVGDGKGQTFLASTDVTSADIVTFTGTGGAASIPLFRDFTIQATSSKTIGAALRFLPSSAELSFITIDNVIFSTIPTGIYFSAASYFRVDKCDFYNYLAQGIHIENTNDNDSGDSFISNCLFNTAVPTGSTYGIWYRTSGGLKIVNTKILGGNSGIVLGFIGSKNVADLLISNCSIENTTAYAIFLGRDSGTSSFGTVQICNTELGCTNGIITDASGFMTLLTIDACTINILGTSNAAQGIALNGVSNINIGTNILNAQAGGAPVGILVTASCSNGKISPQVFTGIPAANCINNSSSSVTYQEIPLNGVVPAITTNAAFGTFFTGTVNVVFPRPFLVAPANVHVDAVSPGNGVFAGGAISITTTGFVAQVFGVTNGGIATGLTYTTQGGIL